MDTREKVGVWFKGLQAKSLPARTRLKSLLWPQKGFTKAQYLLISVLLLLTSSFFLYHAVHPTSPPGYAPAPAPGPNAPAPSPGAGHPAGHVVCDPNASLSPQSELLTKILGSTPGFGDVYQLCALLILVSVLHFLFLDRIKLWEKYKEPRLTEKLSIGNNLLVVATIEFIIMILFFVWLRFITFCGAPLSGILLYVYGTLQVTKVTAECYQKHHPGKLGLKFGLRFVAICQGVAIVLVTCLIPVAPVLLVPILLLLLMVAYVGVLYTVERDF